MPVSSGQMPEWHVFTTCSGWGRLNARLISTYFIISGHSQVKCPNNPIYFPDLISIKIEDIGHLNLSLYLMMNCCNIQKNKKNKNNECQKEIDATAREEVRAEAERSRSLTGDGERGQVQMQLRDPRATDREREERYASQEDGRDERGGYDERDARDARDACDACDVRRANRAVGRLFVYLCFCLMYLFSHVTSNISRPPARARRPAPAAAPATMSNSILLTQPLRWPVVLMAPFILIRVSQSNLKWMTQCSF